MGKSILVVQLNRMGDVLMTGPLLCRLRAQDPAARITLLAYEGAADLLAGTPLVDRLLTVAPGELAPLVDAVCAGRPPAPVELLESYDRLVNLAWDVPPARLARAVRAQDKCGRVETVRGEIRLLGDWAKLLFSAFQDRPGTPFHIADIFSGLGGAPFAPVAPYLRPGPDDAERADRLLDGQGAGEGDGPLVALQMGASDPNRAWGAERFAALAGLLAGSPGARIVLVGGPGDRPLAHRFASLAPRPCIDLVGRTSIAELPAVLSRCRLLVSNDTGPVHVAAAVGTPVLGLYFSCAYAPETGPYGAGHAVLQAEPPCAPCAHGAFCPHMTCRDMLTPESAADAASWLLGAATVPVLPPGVVLYRSRFLSNGLLAYRPAEGSVGGPLADYAFLNRLLWEPRLKLVPDRQAVMETVSGNAGNASFAGLAARLRRETQALASLFRRGAELCAELERQPPGHSRKGGRGEQIVGELGGVETALGDRRPPLAAVKHFYTYELMDVDYLPQPALARQLAGAYRRLAQFTAAGADLYSRLERLAPVAGEAAWPSAVAEVSAFKNRPENRERAQAEWLLAGRLEPPATDVLMVVRDQLPFVRQALESVTRCSPRACVFVWDNGSRADTAAYLDSLAAAGRITLRRSAENLGFIRPNNELAALGGSPTIVLLNSDAEVLPGWDRALVAQLEAAPPAALCGYLGGRVNADGLPREMAVGTDIDYVCGYCLALRRESYRVHGLFDEQLQFAYFEDSDLSLRLLRAGHRLYALHLDLVWHHENRTVSEVQRDEPMRRRMAETFRHNQELFRSRHGAFLAERRQRPGGER